MKNNVFNSKINIFNKKMALVMVCCLGHFMNQATAQCVVQFDQCPVDIYLYDCDNSGGEIINWITPNAVTNGPCQGFSIAQVSGPTPGTLVSLGQYTISYVAQVFDIGTGANRVATCNFTVHVLPDIAPPVFLSCPPDITVYTADPTGTNVYWAQPIVNDNCSPVSSLTSDMPCPAVLPWGEHVITYLAVDDAGNTSSCSFTVSVLNSLLQRTTLNQGTIKHFTVAEDRNNNQNSSAESPERVFKLVPNPVLDNLIVKSNMESHEKSDVQIFDVLGKPILTTVWPEGVEKIDIPVKHLMLGIYFVHISSLEDRKITILKVVKI